MNFLWSIIFIISAVFFIFKDPNLLLSTATQSIYESLKVCFSLAGIYIFWLGIIRIMQDSGLANKLAKCLKPIINWLFGKTDKETSELIAVNLSANLLGIGNASLPVGLKAMEKLDNKRNVVTFQMIMLFALNCCSIQLLPSTIILMRISGGSLNSGDIVIPIIIVSIICFFLTIFSIKLFFKDRRGL